MGPRLVWRGNLFKSATAHRCMNSFNGAAPGLARKRGWHRGNGRSWGPFNGAAPGLARKPALCYREPPGLRSLQWGRAWFGAETPYFRHLRSMTYLPSMGPRLVWRGNSTVLIGLVLYQSSFNGAAPGLARKLRKGEGAECQPAGLQWGRAWFGAETLFGRPVEHPDNAFNGAAPGLARKL